jgi:ribosomal protein S18 acetylase RimI-like enzyme
MQIRLIDTENPTDIREFIQLPFDLYRDNDYWVPPLRSEMRANLDRQKNPFFEHSEADFFLAEESGQVLGRIGVLKNTRFVRLNSDPTGFFYYFDAVDDLRVSRALFQAAEHWAAEQDLTALYGPKGMLQGDGIGTLVEGFNHLPAMGIPYNFPYYDRLILDSGFSKQSDYYSGYLSSDARVPDRIISIANKVRERRGFWVRKFSTKQELLAVAPEIRKVYNASFSGEGFNPITEEEMESIASRILSIADPRLIKLVYKNDQLVGFLFAYPNIGQGLQKARGRLWPLGWFHLWRASRNTPYLDVNGIGILPEHQGVGANAVLYQELEQTFREFDFEHVETVQVREDNRESLGENSALNVRWHKTHRVYTKTL